RVHIRMQKGDRDGFNPLVAQDTERLAHIVNIERCVHFTTHRHPLTDLQTASARDQRWSTLPKYVVYTRPSEAADLQFITKSFGRKETSDRPLPFEHGV